jgi:integrase
VRLTDSRIKSISPKESRFIEWEDGETGLGVRVFPSGVKSFVFMYRFDRKPRMMTIGKYPQVQLVEARRKVAIAREELEKGVDPGKKHMEKKEMERNAHTVKHLVEEYLEKWAKPRKRTWEEDQRCINKEVLPFIGKNKASAIRRRDIILILDRIMDRGSPGMANRTLNVITKLFNFGVERDILVGSPCTGMKMPAKKKQRDRTLTEIEIRKFWNKLPESGISPQVQSALKILFATGQRRGEVVSAEWKDFDLEKGWWEIPASKTKSERSHRIPLNGVAIGLLEEVKKISRDSQYVFPSPRTGTHIDPRAITRALRKAQGYFGMDEEFRPHDLRRSCATHLAEAGINRLIVAKILNHVDESVTGRHYDKYAYSDEKERAMTLWSRKLESIITGESSGIIIELKR